MKVRTDPDVIRKHSRTPRSYHEATGMRFASHKESRIALWMYLVTIAGVAIFILSLLFAHFSAGS